MSKTNEKITVKVINESKPCWYKIGEIHEVLNHITYWGGNLPYFEKNKSTYGILVSDCEVLKLDELPVEYTIEQIEQKLGYKIKIISKK